MNTLEDTNKDPNYHRCYVPEDKSVENMGYKKGHKIDLDITISDENVNENPNIEPKHYTDMVIPPNEYIVKNNLGWNVSNVVKYISRYKKKNGKEDIFKAIKYLQMLLEDEYDVRTELSLVNNSSKS